MALNQVHRPPLLSGSAGRLTDGVVGSRIKNGHIRPGHITRRSIRQVLPARQLNALRLAERAVTKLGLTKLS